MQTELYFMFVTKSEHELHDRKMEFKFGGLLKFKGHLQEE